MTLKNENHVSMPPPVDCEGRA